MTLTVSGSSHEVIAITEIVAVNYPTTISSTDS